MKIHKYFITAHQARPGLEPGMCFTIEPMINAGKRCEITPDEWTVVTKDRKLRNGNTIGVTKLA